MKKNWIWALVILVLLVIVNLIIKTYYDIWSGTGLILNLVIGIPLLILLFILTLKNAPKSEKEMKTFKFEGIFNPWWILISSFLPSIVFTVSVMTGYKDIPIPLIIGAWLFTILAIYHLIKMRKLGL
jgi:hypothetical protein|tara:strand:+ start:795 stop:1175 length:381 start_codon:yes stop_codon:yes gene_type:complete